jgi:hypothetical protein
MKALNPFTALGHSFVCPASLHFPNAVSMSENKKRWHFQRLLEPLHLAQLAAAVLVLHLVPLSAAAGVLN